MHRRYGRTLRQVFTWHSTKEGDSEQDSSDFKEHKGKARESEDTEEKNAK